MRTIRGWASKLAAGDGMMIELIADAGGRESFEVVGEATMGLVVEAFHDGQPRLFDLDAAGRIVAVRPDSES
jgi:hypothetical protein